MIIPVLAPEPGHDRSVVQSANGRGLVEPGAIGIELAVAVAEDVVQVNGRVVEIAVLILALRMEDGADQAEELAAG